MAVTLTDCNSIVNCSSCDQHENISSILASLIYSLANSSCTPPNNNNINNASHEIFSSLLMIVMFVLLTSFIYIIRGGNTNQSRRKPGPGTDVVSDFSTLEMTDSLNNRPRRTRSETQEEEPIAPPEKLASWALCLTPIALKKQPC